MNNVPFSLSLASLFYVSSSPEPPSVVEMRDRNKGPPENGILGPYKEGVMVVFTCLARDGESLIVSFSLVHFHLLYFYLPTCNEFVGWNSWHL